MRIISGELKNRRLKTIKVEGLRPATDRYRQTLFNILNNRIDFDDISVCDLYAGTGAIGFECLSRGAKHCTFVESNKTLANLLEENGKLLGITEKLRIVNTSVQNFLLNTRKKFNLVFSDPPYNDFKVYDDLKLIISNQLVEKGGIFIIQRSKHTLPEDEKNFSRKAFKIIGDDVIFYLEF
ncbi:MAG: 16S rRNA (guanine(966)-N(2))-methyltransferase RsmD [Ignavibacteria bacterium]|nr:16S rRNA (guanine(966)-N(2))-methyltransferase RsmD [Ignavibacteria bacterium]